LNRSGSVAPGVSRASATERTDRVISFELDSLRKRNQIAGQFAARPIEMLKSPGYRVLSCAAGRVLSRIEIEHANHGGTTTAISP
jgi:hypothetical protein